jgi:hypothetical protein
MVRDCGRERTSASVPTGGGGAHPPNGPFLAYSPKCLEEEFAAGRHKGGREVHFRPSDTDFLSCLLLPRCPEGRASGSAHYLHAFLGAK